MGGIFVFGHIDENQQRILAEKAEAAQDFFLFGIQLQAAQGEVVLQVFTGGAQHLFLKLDGGGLHPALVAQFDLFQAFFGHDEVADDHLVLKFAQLAQGVGGAVEAVQFFVREGAQHQGEAFAGFDIRKQRVVRIFRAGREDAGVIPVFYMSIDGLFGFIEFAQAGDALIQHLHHSHIGFVGRRGVFVRGGVAAG